MENTTITLGTRIAPDSELAQKLVHAYTQDLMRPLKEIAKEFGVTAYALSAAAHRAGVPRRPNGPMKCREARISNAVLRQKKKEKKTRRAEIQEKRQKVVDGLNAMTMNDTGMSLLSEKKTKTAAPLDMDSFVTMLRTEIPDIHELQISFQNKGATVVIRRSVAQTYNL